MKLPRQVRLCLSRVAKKQDTNVKAILAQDEPPRTMCLQQNHASEHKATLTPDEGENREAVQMMSPQGLHRVCVCACVFMCAFLGSALSLSLSLPQVT